MNLKKTGCEGVAWNKLGQSRGQCRALVNTVMEHRIPQKAKNFLVTWVTINFRAWPWW